MLVFLKPVIPQVFSDDRLDCAVKQLQLQRFIPGSSRVDFYRRYVLIDWFLDEQSASRIGAYTP